MKKILLVTFFGVLILTGCGGQPTATEAQLSALFSRDSARWESLYSSYQDCVFDWFALNTGEECFLEAKELVSSAKQVLAEYESYSIPGHLEEDASRTVSALESVIDGDIGKACGSGSLPDAELSTCGDAIPGWIARLDRLVKALDRW